MNFLDEFKEVWLADTEFYFQGGEGGLQKPVCAVFKEFRTGREIRLWQDELERLQNPPYDTGPDTITVAYYASAEMGTFLSLGWELPKWVLDLFAEFRSQTNGYTYSNGAGILGALAWYGGPVYRAIEKDLNRELVLKGAGCYTGEERLRILNYCSLDVQCLEKLLVAMQYRLDVFAKFRGRYMKACARMERNGIPIDTALLARIQEQWERLKEYLIDRVDDKFHVFVDGVFKRDLFIDWLQRSEYSWPVLASGQIALDDDTFKGQCQVHPELEPLRQLRDMLGKLRKLGLAVGPDGRNRTILSAFQAKSGRNAPSGTKFIFGPAVWLRSLIKPQEGKTLAYIDWSAAEFAIAASLSKDPCMMEAYSSGDPYLSFARMAGAVPPEATKESHGFIRDMYKQACLGVQYGMGSKRLSANLNIPLFEARDLLNSHKRLFRGFWRWLEQVKDSATLNKGLRTVFGFQYNLVDAKPNLRSVINFPMQGTCAEMMRLACSWAVEKRIMVCCPIHDALLVEADEKDIDEVVWATQRIMEKASRKVLGEEKFEVRTDAYVIRYPERYMDKRGVEMWNLVSNFIGGDSSVQ